MHACRADFHLRCLRAWTPLNLSHFSRNEGQLELQRLSFVSSPGTLQQQETSRGLCVWFSLYVGCVFGDEFGAGPTLGVLPVRITISFRRIMFVCGLFLESYLCADWGVISCHPLAS